MAIVRIGSYRYSRCKWRRKRKKRDNRDLREDVLLLAGSADIGSGIGYMQLQTMRSPFWMLIRGELILAPLATHQVTFCSLPFSPSLTFLFVSSAAIQQYVIFAIAYVFDSLLLSTLAPFLLFTS